MSKGSWLGLREAQERKAEVMDAGVWPGGKEETLRATERLRNRPVCRPV